MKKNEPVVANNKIEAAASDLAARLDLPKDACKRAIERLVNPATDDLILRARATYGSDEIEIDDEEVGTSRSDDGVWVQAWVWLADEEDAS